jgi:serine-type D-Ala-D-Ala carboxypeptidase/endopeptidase (penicillin-binding protein 4)
MSRKRWSLAFLSVLAVVSLIAGTVGQVAATRRADRLAQVAAQISLGRAPSSADRRMARALTTRARSVAPRGLSGAVIDVGSGRLVWTLRGETPRMPASTAKLITATAALNSYGPEHRFTTTVRQGAERSRVALVGAGDPSLSTADLSTLARATAAALGRQKITRVSLRVDDGLFPRPTPAPGWASSYVPRQVRKVRALVVDEHHAADTSMDAGRVFATQLKRAHIKVVGTRRGAAPRKAKVLARVPGDRLSAIVTRMLLSSDNDHAEALRRLVAVDRGQPATWAGAERANRTVLGTHGFTLAQGAIWDGSGLSRSDRIGAVRLARVVRQALDGRRKDLAPLRDGALPVAGRSGTLGPRSRRFITAPSRCAAGRVVAKTGTLRDVVALAGWTRARDGRIKAFAFIVNGPSQSLALKRRVDALAATVNGCY